MRKDNESTAETFQKVMKYSMDSRGCFPSNMYYYMDKFEELRGRELSDKTIAMYLKGRKFPDGVTLNKIAEKTGIPSMELMYNFSRCNVPVFSYNSMVEAYNRAAEAGEKKEAH